MLNVLLVALIATMPVSIMTGQDLPSTVYYVALLTSFAVLIQHRFAGLGEVQSRHRVLITCLSTPLLVVLFSSIWHRQVPGADLETAFRYLLGIWVFLLALRYTPDHTLRKAIWGYLAAGLIATGYIVYLSVYLSWPTVVRPNTDAVYNAVGYGNHTLMLALLSMAIAFDPLLANRIDPPILC